MAISTGSSSTGSWYAYSYTATNFPDYPKYAVWNNCYVVTAMRTHPRSCLPRANMLAGTERNNGTLHHFFTCLHRLPGGRTGAFRR
ncbi:MAG: hypothetical protein IPI05_05335 [Flavobacteriales bacterium]|nr:hypothetical protein [Flavobacteriales bacterium]